MAKTQCEVGVDSQGAPGFWPWESTNRFFSAFRIHASKGVVVAFDVFGEQFAKGGKRRRNARAQGRFQRVVKFYPARYGFHTGLRENGQNIANQEIRPKVHLFEQCAEGS
jgi:hypothetical protein